MRRIYYELKVDSVAQFKVATYYSTETFADNLTMFNTYPKAFALCKCLVDHYCALKFEELSLILNSFLNSLTNLYYLEARRDFETD